MDEAMNGAKRVARCPGGVRTPPPSKSLGHRAVICAALAARGLAAGESVLQNVGRSEDIDATLAGVAALWSPAVAARGDVLRIGPGSAQTGLPRRVDCGESGSTLRFLLPLAALEARETVFTGRGRLLARPLAVYADLFRLSGAVFVQEPRAVRVRGPLRGGAYALPGDVSSQFVSGLLLTLPLLPDDSEIRLTTPLQSRGYVDLTLDVMRRFGVTVTQERESYRIRGGQRYRPAVYQVEADYSQAAFFLAAAALGRPVAVAGLNPESRQGDRAILEILRAMGAETDWRAGVVCVRAERLRAVTVDARETPDIVPPIAALCCFGEGRSRIVGAARLRLKESDRLHALAAELGKLGARVEETEDTLTIEGAPRLAGGRVDAWNDHRIAMALAVAALRCDGPVLLTGWRSVAKS
ncbi:MAG: 3-phosphoshikimate 1-carboxyvinyltransferase, partial [Oscillospiraceae bacterium]|nr:3-phosphoshikimate 1-carboxyvinyltransferase [Oscillospiraceae bacterium]